MKNAQPPDPYLLHVPFGSSACNARWVLSSLRNSVDVGPPSLPDVQSFTARARTCAPERDGRGSPSDLKRHGIRYLLQRFDYLGWRRGNCYGEFADRGQDFAPVVRQRRLQHLVHLGGLRHAVLHRKGPAQ
jgi:hypothetical protein